ncbi:MAG: hypothetical protein JO165_03810 [Candidatus Eremiobacteraeota bacterium]|nr:hypothetical protein [Candidatus Eremiobacteraeota bacterium]
MRHPQILIVAAVALFLLCGAAARADDNPCTALGLSGSIGINVANPHSEIPNATAGSLTPDRQGTGVYGQQQVPGVVPTEPPLTCGTLIVSVVTKVPRTCADFAIDYVDADGKLVWSTAKLSPLVNAVSDPSTCTYSADKIPTNRKLIRVVRFTGDPQVLRDRGVDPAKFIVPGRTAVYFNSARKASDRIEIATHP